MGALQSRQDDPLWRAVKTGDEDAVKALHAAGASLESLDRSGKTPLIAACNQPLDMSDMVQLLLSLGANPNASGFWSSPLHLAAERGHKDTVSLLLDYGANPWAVNHDGSTPLDVARAKEHAAVVRVIEGKLCFFSGTVRETKAGNGFLQALLPGMLTKVWAVVLPSEAPRPGKPPKLDLVIYQQPRTTPWDEVAAVLGDVAVPRTVLHLGDCHVKAAIDTQPPVLVITHKTTREQYMFLAEVEGNWPQFQAFWRACTCSPQPGGGAAANSSSSSSSTAGPAGAGKAKGPGVQVPRPGQDAAKGLQISRRPDWVTLLVQVGMLLAKALWQALDTVHIKVDISEDATGGSTNVKVHMDDATPSAKGINVTYSRGTPSAQQQHSNGSRAGSTGTGAPGRGPFETSRRPGSSSSPTAETRHGQSSGTSSVSSQATASSTPRDSGGARVPDSDSTRVGSPAGDVAGSARPSAPPLPAEFVTSEGQVLYPTVDTSPVHVVDEPSAGDKSASAKPAGAGHEEGRCVICWDAPAQAACVPCGHLVGCMDCLSGIKGRGLGCPVCRAPIQQLLKVYKG